MANIEACKSHCDAQGASCQTFGYYNGHGHCYFIQEQCSLEDDETCAFDMYTKGGGWYYKGELHKFTEIKESPQYTVNSPYKYIFENNK